jgi:pSer/pThr/pTyr-binding forkhead associated (FHA) protein
MPEEDNEQGTIRYVRCPSCGMPNPATSATCFRCGKSMQGGEDTGSAPQAKAAPPAAQTDVVCSKCKKTLPPGSKFCGFCGTPLPAAPPPRPPERAAPPAPAEPQAPPLKKTHLPAPPANHVAPPAVPSARPAAKAEQPPPAAPAPSGSPLGTQIFSGLKVPKIDASVVEIKSDDSPGKTIRIVKETFIGRTGCDLSYPNDALLSQRHASVNKREGKVLLKDIASQNGTFIKQRQDSEINAGDVFVLGRELFRFTTQRMEPAPQDVMGTALMSGAPRLQPGPITAKLEHIQLSGDAIKEYSLDKPETTIGRTTGDIVFADDPYMSGTHARIVAQPGRFILQDMKSRNGIYRRIRESVALQDGDEFFLGEERFRVDVKIIED